MMNQNKTAQWMVAIVFAMIIAIPAAIATEKSETKTYLQQIYMRYLQQEGYSPSIDSDGDVRFKSEGHNFFIEVNDKDPEYVNIVMPNIWSIDDTKEKLQALVAADYTNHKIKAVKLYLHNENTWAAIESFVADPEDFKGIFKRSLSALVGGAMQFARKMRSMHEEEKTNTSSTERQSGHKQGHNSCLPEPDKSIGMI